MGVRKGCTEGPREESSRQVMCTHQGAKACDETTGAGRHTADLRHGPLGNLTLSSLALASRFQSFETVNTCCR